MEKNMKKIASLVCCLALLLVCGCAAIYSSLMEDSPLVLAYGADEGIKDQAQVATLAINKDYGLWLNGEEINTFGGGINPDLRVSKNLAGRNTILVDVLPGTYRVAIMGSVTQSGGGTTYTTTEPAEQTYAFQAGKIYSIELFVAGISGSVLIREMSAGVYETVANNRSKAVF